MNDIIKEETIKGTAKIVVSSVPIIGQTAVSIYETLESIAAKKEIQRLSKSVEAISLKINELNLNTPLPLPYEGQEILFDMLTYTKTIYTEFKRNCLANLIKNLVYEVERKTFEHRTYRIVFDQFSKLQDPELSLLKLMHENKGSFIYENHLVSKIKLLELSNNSEYCIVQLENTGVLRENIGFVSSHPDAMKGEYIFTAEAKTLANKLFEDCSI